MKLGGVFPVALVISIWACAFAAVAAASPVKTSATDPHPGIHEEEWADATVPWTAHLVKVDLTSAEIGVFATAPADAGKTVSQYSTEEAAQVAINGDSFSAAGYVPVGLAIGDEMAWTNTADDATSAVFHFVRVGERTTAAIEPPEQITTAQSLPAGTAGAISGRPLLVRAGAVTAQFDCTNEIAIACERAPRTAIAVSADGNTLWLIVVDGWQTSSLGMLDTELGSFLAQQGADMAIAVDPGASSTLVMDGVLASSPSDGVERTVANHLAVKYGALPTGQLVGLTCKMDVFGCGSNAAQKLTGVTVTLDDGRVQTTGSDAFYDYEDVTQRLACVTAKKTGYITKHQCAQVNGSGMTYNSIAMFPGTDPPVDAGVVPVDAPETSETDAGTPGGRDGGGNPATGSGGGCCDAGGSPAGAIGAIYVALLATWFLLRRRGTTG